MSEMSELLPEVPYGELEHTILFYLELDPEPVLESAMYDDLEIDCESVGESIPSPFIFRDILKSLSDEGLIARLADKRYALTEAGKKWCTDEMAPLFLTRPRE